MFKGWFKSNVKYWIVFFMGVVLYNIIFYFKIIILMRIKKYYLFFMNNMILMFKMFNKCDIVVINKW